MQVVRGMSAGARIFEYLSLKPTIPLSGGGRIPFHSLIGRVDFMNISFRLNKYSIFYTSKNWIKLLDNMK